MRVEAGAVVDEFGMPGVGQVVARHCRAKAPDGTVQWACTFTIVAAGADDLAVVHRLSAPTLAEARRCVRNAVEFLAGRAVTPIPAPEPSPHPVSPRRRESDRAPRIPVFDLPAGFDGAGPPTPLDRRRTPTPLS